MFEGTLRAHLDHSSPDLEIAKRSSRVVAEQSDMRFATHVAFLPKATHRVDPNAGPSKSHHTTDV